MKLTNREVLVNKADKVVRELFDKTSNYEIKDVTRDKIIEPGCMADFVYEISNKERPEDSFNLYVEVKASGEPRTVLDIIHRVKSYTQGRPTTTSGIVTPYLSERSRQICTEHDVNCIDLSGNALFKYKNLFIEISGNPNRFKTKRGVKTLFSPKSSRVIRALLVQPNKRWHVSDLAKEVGISIGQVSNVKKLLKGQELIKEENKRFWLINAKELLELWERRFDYRKSISTGFYSSIANYEIEREISTECNRRNIRYALTLFSGARLLEPHVFMKKSFVYIERDIEHVAGAVELRPVSSGANIELLKPYDEGVYYGMQEKENLNVVSDIQLYLDLKSYPGRAEEAANAIWERRIKPKWEQYQIMNQG